MSPELTVALAIYAAILSTISAIVRIVEFSRDRTKIEVKVRTARFNNGRGGVSESLISLEAVNHGKTDVIISEVGWMVNNKAKYVLPVTPSLKLPYTLKPGASATTYRPVSWYQEHDLASSHVIKSAFIQDQTGKRWIGKVTRKQKRKWANQQDDGQKLTFINENLFFPGPEGIYSVTTASD